MRLLYGKITWFLKDLVISWERICQVRNVDLFLMQVFMIRPIVDHGMD